MEIDFQVAAPDFATKHPELHHYTNFNGLRGIIESNTLWATHFAYLNDSSEVTLLQKPMVDTLSARALSKVKELLAGESSTLVSLVQLELDRGGGASVVVPEMTKDFVGALYGAAFNATSIEPMAEPYITSFCAHALDQTYEIANGLLSQWRAYGGQEQYCIVFDTAELIKLLLREFDSQYYVYTRLDEVHYARDDARIETIFPDLVSSSEGDLIKAMSGAPIEIAAQTLVALFSAAPRFKHQGFKEELEVRVVAIPGKQKFLERVRAEHPGQEERAVKSYRSKAGANGDRPYIALFDELGEKLPIKRIIVGPSRNQKEYLNRARQVLGEERKIDCSMTPFIG
jgi:hypothetical protein